MVGNVAKNRARLRGVLASSRRATSSWVASKSDLHFSQHKPFKALYLVRSIPISIAVKSDCFKMLRVLTNQMTIRVTSFSKLNYSNTLRWSIRTWYLRTWFATTSFTRGGSGVRRTKGNLRSMKETCFGFASSSWYISVGSYVTYRFVVNMNLKLKEFYDERNFEYN